MTLSKNAQGQFMNSLHNLKQSNIHQVGKKLKLSVGVVVMVRKDDLQLVILLQSPPNQFLRPQNTTVN